MTRRLLRIACATALVATASFASATLAQDTAVQRGNQLAYDYSIKCFVTNSMAVGERRNAGDQTAAARYEANARRSFETVSKLGGALNYSGERINEDYGLAQSVELPKMMRDKAYSQKVIADCKSLGLM